MQKNINICLVLDVEILPQVLDKYINYGDIYVDSSSINTLLLF